MKEEEKNSLTRSVSNLVEAVEKLMSKRYFQIVDNTRKFLFYNFLAGLAKGLGFMIGASLIFALIIWLLSKLSLVPVIGDWVTALLDYIERVR